MSARLVPLNAGVAPTIPLQRPVLLIGRHPECDVRIDLGKISRRHCCVALAYDRVMIRDLGSRNGLRVNGLPVEEAQLHPGDEVAIGPIIYRMEGEAPAPPPPIPSPPRPAASVKPPSLPDLHDPDGDLIPVDF
jgi:predicted component of type VI protein secretion system